MVSGIGVLALLAAVTRWLQAPGSRPLERAFGVLVFYIALFLVSLLKVWWTARRPAVVVETDRLGYQPLHRFSAVRVPFERILFCGPREATHSLRVVHEQRAGRARELYLNLAVIDGRNELIDLLGSRLEEAGLEPVPGRAHTWRRKAWALTGVGDREPTGSAG
jgi:hypothetical protein